MECCFFFPWLLLFLSFSANHQAGLASWAALLKGSYPPKREKPEVSENTHPPCSFLSLSLPICALEWGKRFLGEGVLIPALPCLVVKSGGSFTPFSDSAFPSVKSGSWTWWHLTAWSAFFPISVSGLGTPLTILQRHCCFEHVLFRASQHDPPFSWLTTQDFQAGIYSPPHILGASEEADSIPHLPLPPPLGPCARSKLICELHPLGDFSPKWIQPAEVWRFCLLAGGKNTLLPRDHEPGTKQPSKTGRHLGGHERRKKELWERNHHKGGGQKGNLGLGRIIIKTTLKTHPITSQDISQLDFSVTCIQKLLVCTDGLPKPWQAGVLQRCLPVSWHKELPFESTVACTYNCGQCFPFSLAISFIFYFGSFIEI